MNTQDNTKPTVIICQGGRCSSWGTTWKRHYYDGGEQCLRCGMSRQEQWEEDKAAGLVTGEYVPNTGKPRAERKSTSKRRMYCAVGEYGIEFASVTRKECKAWIDDQMTNEDIDPNYYSITTMTKAELDALPED